MQIEWSERGVWSFAEVVKARGEGGGALWDADEALREQVKQEATEKLITRNGHHFLSIVVGRVTPAKGNLAVR